jgi:hypothetical protein
MYASQLFGHCMNFGQGGMLLLRAVANADAVPGLLMSCPHSIA